MSIANSGAESWVGCAYPHVAETDYDAGVARVPCCTPVPVKATTLCIDVELLRRSVDRQLMAEQHTAQLTPRDLYIKSHPGLLTEIDFTNPRNWYSSRAHVQVSESPSKKTAHITHVCDVTFPVLDTPNGPTTLQNHNVKENVNNCNEPELFVLANAVGEHTEQPVNSNQSAKSEPTREKVCNEAGIEGVGLSPTSQENVTAATNEGKNFTLPVILSDKDKLRHNSAGNKARNCKYMCIGTQFQNMPSEHKREMIYANIQKRLAETLQHSKDKLTQFPETRPQVVVAEKYQELILPKHDTEREKFENLHKNYTLNQKSALKLKFLPKRHKKRNKRKSANSSKKNRVEPRACASGEEENSGAHVVPDARAPTALQVSPARRGGQYDQPQVVPPTDDVDGKNPPSKAPETRRYVYKAPDDGYLQRMSQIDGNRAAVINLSIAKKAPKRLHEPITGSYGHNVVNGNHPERIVETRNDSKASERDTMSHLGNPSPVGTPSARSGRMSKKSLHSESNVSFGSAMSTMRKFKTLEVFSEKRKNETANESEDADLTDDVVTGNSKTHTTTTRPPVYRMDPIMYTKNQYGKGKSPA